MDTNWLWLWLLPLLWLFLLLLLMPFLLQPIISVLGKEGCATQKVYNFWNSRIWKRGLGGNENKDQSSLRWKQSPCEGCWKKNSKEKRSEISKPLSFIYFIPIWFAVFKCQHCAWIGTYTPCLSTYFLGRVHEMKNPKLCAPCAPIPSTLTWTSTSPEPPEYTLIRSQNGGFWPVYALCTFQVSFEK